MKKPTAAELAQRTIIGGSDEYHGPPEPRWWQTEKGRPFKKWLDTRFRKFQMRPAYDSPTLAKLLFRIGEEQLPGRKKKGIDWQLIALFEKKMAAMGLSPEAVAPYLPRRQGSSAKSLARTYYRERKKLDEYEAFLQDILRS